MFIKKIHLIFIWLYIPTIVFADPASEALIMAARAKGTAVYGGCILKPPTTPPEVAYCSGIYSIYVAALQAINAPLPLAPTMTPSQYSWSPYDLCKYETSHFVFNTPGQPYCPAL